MKQFSAVPGVAWPAVDGLGRAVPVQNEARVLRKEKFTGIFYFLTHLKEAGANGPYDVTKILLEQRENPLGDESIWDPPGHPITGENRFLAITWLMTPGCSGSTVIFWLTRV